MNNRATFFLVSFLFLSVTAHAQTGGQFGITGISTGVTSSVGAIYHFTDALAFQAIMVLQQQAGQEQVLAPSSSVLVSQDDNEYGFKGVGAKGLWYMPAIDDVRFFVGASFIHYLTTERNEYKQQTGASTKITHLSFLNSETSVVGGFQYMLSKQIALTGELRFGGLSYSGTRDTFSDYTLNGPMGNPIRIINVQKTETHFLSLRTSSALGIILYFR
jgi:hypothetical protein